MVKKITLDDESYWELKKLKAILKAKTWKEFVEKIKKNYTG